MANYCPRCGNPLPQGSNTCPVCNPGISQPEASTRTTLPTSTNQSDFKNPAKINIGGIEINIRTSMLIIAAIEIFLFFMPLITASCYGVSVTFNGFNLVFGKNIPGFGSTPTRVDGNFAAILLLAIPVLLFLVFWSKKQLSFVHTRLFITSTALSVAGFIGLIVLSNVAKNYAEQQMMQASVTFWYGLSMILYIVSALVSVGCVLFGNKNIGQLLTPSRWN